MPSAKDEIIEPKAETGSPARAGPLLLPLSAVRTHSSGLVLVLWPAHGYGTTRWVRDWLQKTGLRGSLNVWNLTAQLEEEKRVFVGKEKLTMDVITESELAKHYEVHNLWVSIRGKVYDVSSYVDDHPGGVEVLKDVAGSDGTESFEYVGHSEDAYKTLAKFQIGILEGETHEVAPVSSQAWDVQRAQLQSASLKSKVSGWPLAVTFLLAAGIASRWLLQNQEAYEKTAFIFVWHVSSPFWTGILLATLVSMSAYLYLYARFTKTLEYYKEVWEYPSYFSCKANRANI